MFRALRARWRRRRRRGKERGQTTTEYLLVVGMIVISLIGAASNLYPLYQAGVQKLAQDVEKMLTNGKF